MLTTAIQVAAANFNLRASIFLQSHDFLGSWQSAIDGPGGHSRSPGTQPSVTSPIASVTPAPGPARPAAPRRRHPGPGPVVTAPWARARTARARPRPPGPQSAGGAHRDARPLSGLTRKGSSPDSGVPAAAGSHSVLLVRRDEASLSLTEYPGRRRSDHRRDHRQDRWPGY